MKQLLFTLGSILLATSAHGAIVTYDYTAEVQAMFEYDGVRQVMQGVSSSTLSGVMIAQGHTVHGRFSYDTATPFVAALPTANGRRHSGSNFNTATIVFDQTGYTYQSNAPMSAFLEVYSNPAGTNLDTVLMSTKADGSPGKLETAGILLSNAHGIVYDSFMLPGALDFAAFAFSSVTYTYTRLSDGSRVGAGARLTSMRLAVAEVPEPASIALLMLGLVAIGGANVMRPRRHT